VSEAREPNDSSLFQIVSGHVLEIDLLGSVDVGGIGQNANGHARTWDIGKSNDSRETLVSLRIVVLEANLQLDCFDEITLLLAVGIDEEVPDEAPHT